MSILYHILRSIEILITIITAAGVLTYPYKFRWNEKISKILVEISWAMIAILSIGNSFFFKASGSEYIIVTCLSMALVLIFYQIPAPYAIAVNTLFWGTIYVIRYAVMIFSSGKMDIGEIFVYNMDFSRIHPMELAESIVVIGIMMLLIRRNKPVLPLRKKRECWVGILLGVVEWYMAIFELPYDLLNPKQNWQDSRLAILVMSVALCVCGLYAMWLSHTEEKRILQLLELKDSMLEEQLTYMRENYEIKRKQIHDGLQQNLLLKGYLAQGKMDKAYQYLEKLEEELKETQIKGETGITPIDIMLHYKKITAEDLGISIVANVEMYFCPMSDNDICVLLGNLFDNAIDAVSELKVNKRKIDLSLKTVNQMFFLVISNPYEGKRRGFGGQYHTTKQAYKDHGIGLESCRQIVEKYGGTMQIRDDGNRFSIEIEMLHVG